MSRDDAIEVEQVLWRHAGSSRPGRAPRSEAPHLADAELDALVDAALGHPDAQVRRRSLDLLVDTADQRATSVLLACLRDPVPRMRRRAVALLADRVWAADPPAPDVAPYFRVLARTDPNPKVRSAAERVLAGGCRAGRAA